MLDHSHAVNVAELPRRLLVTGVRKGCRLYRVIPEARYRALEQRREPVRNLGNSGEKLGRAFGDTKSRSRTTVIRKGTSRRHFTIWSKWLCSNSLLHRQDTYSGAGPIYMTAGVNQTPQSVMTGLRHMSAHWAMPDFDAMMPVRGVSFSNLLSYVY